MKDKTLLPYRRKDSRQYQEKLDQQYKDQFLLDMEELWVNTWESHCRVLCCGNPRGKPLIMLHGTRMMASMLLEGARSFCDDFRIYIPDLPGDIGFSTVQEKPRDIESFVSWLDSLADELGLDRFYLLGASLGAYIAMKYCSIPEQRRVIKAGYIAASGLTGVHPRFLFQGLFISMFPRRSNVRSFYNWIQGPSIPSISEEKLDEHFQSMKHLKLLYSIFPSPLKDEELRAHRVPCLFLYGEGEVLNRTDEAVLRVKELLPEARVELIAQRRHILLPRDYSPLVEFFNSEDAG